VSAPALLYLFFIIIEHPDKDVAVSIIPALAIFSCSFYVLLIIGYAYRSEKQPLLARSNFLTLISSLSAIVFCSWIMLVDYALIRDLIGFSRGWCAGSEALLIICCINMSLPLIIRSYRLKKIFSDNITEHKTRSFSHFSSISQDPEFRPRIGSAFSGGDIYRSREGSRSSFLEAPFIVPGSSSPGDFHLSDQERRLTNMEDGPHHESRHNSSARHSSHKRSSTLNTARSSAAPHGSFSLEQHDLISNHANNALPAPHNSFASTLHPTPLQEPKVKWTDSRLALVYAVCRLSCMCLSHVCMCRWRSCPCCCCRSGCPSPTRCLRTSSRSACSWGRPSPASSTSSRSYLPGRTTAGRSPAFWSTSSSTPSAWFWRCISRNTRGESSARAPTFWFHPLTRDHEHPRPHRSTSRWTACWSLLGALERTH
jgi:hypothetical protein